MKNILVKLFSLLVVFALMVSFAGCANPEETNSSLPTSSVNSNVTSSENVSSQEEKEDFDEEDEDIDDEDEEENIVNNQKEEYYDDYGNCKVFPKGACVELSHKNVKEIVSKYLNLHNWLDYKPDNFLASLGVEKDFKYYIDDRMKVGNTTLHKTNIKYSDYKEKMLTYVSQKHFNETEFSSKEVFAQKDGYLYTVVRKYGDIYDISTTVFFEKQENGKYVYLVYCSLYNEEKPDSNCWLRVSIKKENDIYVLDSCKAIDRKEVDFKGYDTLTDETAMAITYNRYNLVRKYNGSTENFLNLLNIVDKVKFYDEKIVVSEECVLNKTNIKYKDFENKLLKYISKKHLKKFFLGGEFYTEKNGYLYINRSSGVSVIVDILEIKFVREENGKYIYRAKCIDNSDPDDPRKFSAAITIIEQNGIYVFDGTTEV